MSREDLDENFDIYNFVKYFVISAERGKNAPASREVLELITAACQAIPYAGAVLGKAGKKAQEISQRKDAQNKNNIIDSSSSSNNCSEELDREDKFRRIMILAAVEIYTCFKYQLKNIYFVFKNNKSRELAIESLAEFAGLSCLQQLVDTRSAENLHKNIFQNSSKLKSKFNFLSSNRTQLEYQLEDTKSGKTFKLSTTNFEFFQKWIPVYLPHDQVVAETETKILKQNEQQQKYVWVNKKSKEKRGLDCCYYLRPPFSWEIEAVQESDLEILDITESCRALEEFSQRDQDNDNDLLVDQLLRMLHHDEHYDLNLATFSFVKTVDQKIDSLHLKVDVVLENTGNKELKASIETQVKEENSLLQNEYKKFAHIFLQVKDIIKKGGNLDERENNSVDVDVDENRVVDILKEISPKLGLNWAKSALGISQYPIQKAGSVLMINNVFETKDFYLMERRGAKNDSDRFTKFFWDALGINIQCKLDVNSTDLPGIIERFKEECNGNDSSFCIVIISTHSDRDDDLIMNDGKAIQFFPYVFDRFTHDNFSKFINKPKLFFLEGCTSLKGRYSSKSNAQLSRGTVDDYFIGFSSLPGCDNYRNTKDGCFYSQALLESFEKFWKIKDVAEMHEYASRAVEETLKERARESVHVKDMAQRPWAFNSLRHPFYFVE